MLSAIFFRARGTPESREIHRSVVENPTIRIELEGGRALRLFSPLRVTATFCSLIGWQRTGRRGGTVSDRAGAESTRSLGLGLMVRSGRQRACALVRRR